MSGRDDAVERDDADPLGLMRALFDLPAEVIYLDGNSLGAMPIATAARLRRSVEEWGGQLVGAWNSADWMQLPRLVGDKIALLVGAGPGEIAVADSTSINMFKALSAAARLAVSAGRDGGVILSERDNFPTDLYIAQSVASARGLRLELVSTGDIADRLGDASCEAVAVLMLTHVNYRTGAMHDMAATNARARRAGALTVWDLAHSAGAVEVDLTGADADFAVGCGYKYLNGGPGAPAFVWVNPRHIGSVDQPLHGWMGHAAPFDFTADYRPADGIGRFLCGSPAVLSLVALDAGVDTVLAARTLGGMAALRAKSAELTELFISLVEPICSDHGMRVATPSEPCARGSQVSLVHPEDAHPIVQALIGRGVIGDFRSPDVLRFGFAPLYTRFVDVWDASRHLRAVLDSGEWRDERFRIRAAVS